jgi:transcriptional regulator with XRE-family HTH domain
MAKNGNTKSAFAVRAGGRVRDTREARGWVQRELAEKTGSKLSASRIANYEQGIREMGIQEAEILGKALGVQPGYLMGVTALKTPLTPIEEELIRNYRALPENDREAYFRRIEALALAHRTPVPDEDLGVGWKAPPPPEVPEPPKPPQRPKAHRRKTAKTPE